MKNKVEILARPNSEYEQRWQPVRGCRLAYRREPIWRQACADNPGEDMPLEVIGIMRASAWMIPSDRQWRLVAKRTGRDL